jgi:hypothetical protein
LSQLRLTVEREAVCVGGIEHVGGVSLVTMPVGIARVDTRIDPMSDHTEQVRNLRDRILAAKEFL